MALSHIRIATFALTITTAAQASTFIPLPCISASGQSGAGLLRSCTELTGKIKTSVNQHVDQKLACFYQQKDTDLAARPASGTADCSTNAKPFESPCNLAQGEVSAPNGANHPNFNSCGVPSILSGGKIWAAGTVGTLERSYYNGAYVQSLRSCRAAILKEIQDKKGFNAGSCGATMAADAAATTETMNAAASTVNDIAGFKESGSVEAFCSGTRNTQGAAQGAGSEQAQHRMAVCHLSAARSAAESMFTRMASCEIYARWSVNWLSQYAQLVNGIQTQVMDYCQAESQKVPDHEIGFCPVCVKLPVPGEIEDAYNKCYRSRLPTVFKDLVTRLFPEDGSLCPAVGGGP